MTLETPGEPGSPHLKITWTIVIVVDFLEFRIDGKEVKREMDVDKEPYLDEVLFEPLSDSHRRNCIA